MKDMLIKEFYWNVELIIVIVLCFGVQYKWFEGTVPSSISGALTCTTLNNEDQL